MALPEVVAQPEVVVAEVPRHVRRHVAAVGHVAGFVVAELARTDYGGAVAEPVVVVAAAVPELCNKIFFYKGSCNKLKVCLSNMF